MLRHPVVVTSLEEDFRALGLLTEAEAAAPQKDAPKEKLPAVVGCDSDKAKDKGEDGTDEAPNHQGDKPKEKKLPVTTGAQSEATEEDEEDAEESVELTGAASVIEAVSRLRDGSASDEQTASAATSEVDSLIEGVRQIMESIENKRRSESVKAFANVAIIAEMLRSGFAGFADQYTNPGLSTTAKALGTLSEEAAGIARALDEGVEIDRESLESEFRNQMTALVQGLDLYSDVVEAAEMSDDDEDDKDDDKKSKKSKKDDEDGDDDEDDKEESVQDETVAEDSEGEQEEAARFQSPLVKKNGKKGGTMMPSTGAKRMPAGGLVSSKSEAYFPLGKGKKAG